MALLDERHDVNGFIFNGLGDLVDRPEDPTLSQIKEAMDILHGNGDYVEAGKIIRLVNAHIGF